MTEKAPFILVSLEEAEAKNLAQVLSNDTARKILDALSLGDKSESELAKLLDVPLSTVHYNMSLLRKSGLVHVESFHYSDKGKEVNHYSLSNKYVIIAPKAQTLSLRERLSQFFPVVFLLAAAGVLASWIQQHALRRQFAGLDVAPIATMRTSTSPPLNVPAAEVAIIHAPMPEGMESAGAKMVADSSPASTFSMQSQDDLGAGVLINESELAAMPPADFDASACPSIDTSAVCQPQSVWWTHPVLWLLIGAVLVLLALWAISWRHKKSRQKSHS